MKKNNPFTALLKNESLTKDSYLFQIDIFGLRNDIESKVGKKKLH